MITEKKKCPFADKHDDLICIHGRIFQRGENGQLLYWASCPKTCVKATGGVK